ncbi:MAG: replication-relaxation family protein [Chloroflexota bacterium]
MVSSNNDGKRRLPQERSENPPPMRESDNDRRIVQFVYRYRILSQKHVEMLLERSPSTVQRLLRRLYDHRYLERLFLPVTTLGSSPALYILDKRGVSMLQRMGIEVETNLPSKSLSSMFLDHTLAINTFRIAITQACQRQGYEIVRWLTDHDLKSDYDRVKVVGKQRAISLIPDSYFQLYVPERGTGHFFVELDRGTMTTERFADKVRAYVSYYKSNQFEQRYRAKGFRVLTVVDGIGDKRVNNLFNAADRVGRIGRRFWFTHLNLIDTSSVLTDAIWRVSGEPKRQSLL